MQERTRERLAEYRETHDPEGRSGLRVDCTFAIAAIEDVLRRADEAVMSGDVVAMIRAYQEMRTIK